ncbi:MAG TPA: response regulator transcription factor [Thermoanaerobaculia bacterium]|nr:response regulator transcription factor [Thermoanaerobaculia bacterium]
MTRQPAAVPLRLVLADDHPIVLDGLEQLFRLEPELEVVARCRDAAAALAAVDGQRPDVLILDLKMPGGGGLGVLRELATRHRPPGVVLLTAALDEDELIEAVRLGARGVVLKEMAPQLLLEAVRRVAAGGEWLEEGLGGRAIKRLLARHLAAAAGLTVREEEIVRLAARGLRNREIGDQLHISEGTVKVHLHNVFAKLGCENRVEMVLRARERGLV